MNYEKERAKTIYYNLGNIRCPAFGNKVIYFNKYGLKHLLRKGRKLRGKIEIARRIELLLYVKDILESAMSYDEYREEKRFLNNVFSTAHFWSLHKIYKSRKIIVIVRQIDDGKIHFFSIMDVGFINDKSPD